MTATKDITKALVQNGVMVQRTLEDTVTIDNHTYRTDDPDAKAVGVYEYWYELASPPAGKKAQPNRVIDVTAGTVTDGFLYVDMTAEDIRVADNARIKSEIAAVEQTISPRRLRDAVLTGEGKVWLAARGAELTALRSQLK